MAKVIIEFDTEKDDYRDIKAAIEASRLAVALWHIYCMLPTRDDCDNVLATKIWSEVFDDLDITEYTY